MKVKNSKTLFNGTFLFLIGVLFFGGCKTTSTKVSDESATARTTTAANLVPAFDHIVVVIGENTAAGSVFGSHRRIKYLSKIERYH